MGFTKEQAWSLALLLLKLVFGAFYVVVVFVLVRHRKVNPFKGSFFVLFQSNAVSDLVLLLVTCTHSCIVVGITDLFKNERMRLFYSTFAVFTYVWMGLASTMHLTAIAWNRYDATISPLSYKTLWLSDRVRRVIVIVWIVPLFFAVPVLQGVRLINQGMECWSWLFECTWLLPNALVFYVAVMIANIVFCYGRVVVVVQKRYLIKKWKNSRAAVPAAMVAPHGQPKQRDNGMGDGKHEAELRARLTVAGAMFTWPLFAFIIVCYITLQPALPLHDFVDRHFWQVIEILSIIYNCQNPFLLFWSSTAVRKKVIELLRSFKTT